MKFPADAPVTAAKLTALRQRVTGVGLDLSRLEERAIRSGGPGGQKVNKTSSGVWLRYALAPERIVIVKWTRERQHALNRFLALRELVDRVEALILPGGGPKQQAIAKVRRQKDRRRRRRAAVGTDEGK